MDDQLNGIGEAPKRVEDVRFLTGSGLYIDDMSPEDMVQAVVLRSPHAHAIIQGIDTCEAQAIPGVLCILTGQDQAAAGIGPIAPHQENSPLTGHSFRYPPRMPLALDRVRHIGEPVALIVAETRDIAWDAAESISVNYEILPAAITIDSSLLPEAVPLSKKFKNNLCIEEAIGDRGAVVAAFKGASHIARLDLVNHRIITSPMEPRGAIGTFDPDNGQFTLHVSSQALHIIRKNVAATLGISLEDIRLIAPDVGGGFGAKNFPYPEYVLTLWAAREVGRPVKLLNTRSDSFVGDDQARDHLTHAELALDSDGKFLALRVLTRANLGAYLTGAMGAVGSIQYVALMGTVYALPAFWVKLQVVHTNTVPVGVTRGPGFSEAVYLIERLIDQAAREMGFDAVELRQLNLVPSKDFPFTNAHGTTIDTGDFPATLNKALLKADCSGYAKRREGSKRRGCLRGLGIAHHIKITLGPPEENVELRFDEDNQVTLITGTIAIGQGHETTFRQLVAEKLGIPNTRIRYHAGDTDLIPIGGGHGSSRATFMAGTAVHFAAEQIIEKGSLLAAKMLEVTESDIEFSHGRFIITGTDRGVGIFDVADVARDPARIPDGMEPGLAAYHVFMREQGTFPNGCHIAEIEIDPDTGVVTLEKYVAVDDFGVIVNPMIAAGQIHGGIAQGIGQALLERGVYDPGTGQLLSGSFMDYALPRADDLPYFDLTFQGIPCATNPLGVKGLGEAGTIGAFPAVINAVLDALTPYGITEFDGPATAQSVWRVIQGL